jgi:hypothetical protein
MNQHSLVLQFFRSSVLSLIFCFFVLSFFASFVSFSIAGQLVYSTYLGGGSSDIGKGIAVDGSGNAYITGETWSTDFPTTTGAYDTTYNGDTDVFVSKLNPSGTALVYSTYLGGGSSDIGKGIAVDGSGNAYLTGYTDSSTDFPTTPGAFNTSYNGYQDVFVTKLNASGTALVYSTYLGGSIDDVGYGIALDLAGNAYITGVTYSTDFPTTLGAFDTTKYAPSLGAFVIKLNASGSSLVYSTYLGGGLIEEGNGIAIDSSGNAYITGYTWGEFPTTPGAFDTSFNGGYHDGFVSKLNPSGTGLVYSTYLGGSDWDVGNAIAVDASGNAYITGWTTSSTFPTTPGAFDTSYNGFYDVFVSKLNPSGTALVYSTYLGGGLFEEGNGIATDSSGNAYITGETLYYSDFPTTLGAFDTSFNGGSYDGFISKFSFAPLVGDAVYSDINKNSLVDSGDSLTVQFDKRVRVNSSSPASFYLPVTGNTLGTGATVSINTANDTQVVVNLGTSPNLKISGLFSMSQTTAGSASGIDISATMAPNAIEGLDGFDAQDGGVPKVNDSGMDILYNAITVSTAVPAFSAATVQVSTDTINAYYTQHKLVIPTNSLLTGATITAGPPGNNRSQLSAVSFSPSNVTFSTQTLSTLVIEYKDADTKREAGYLEHSMRIHQWKDTTTGWVVVPETYGKQSVDLVNKTVSIKINKFDMLGSKTTVVYANIALPSVGATTTTVAPAPSGFSFQDCDGALYPERSRRALRNINQQFASGAELPQNRLLFSPTTSVTLSVTTAGIYTKHKLTLTDYTTAYSGITVILTQATLAEMQGWQNYAVIKIITLGAITTRAMLTMEYKDHDDTTYNQIKNDVLGGTEYQMRIYRWRDDLVRWEKLPEPQTIDTTENKVTGEINNLSLSQIYAVEVDASEPPMLCFNSNGSFADSSDLTHWYWEKYGDGTTAGTLSWANSYGSQSGLTKVTQKPGEKGKLTQVFSVSSAGWYTAVAKVATDIVNTTKQQKVYLYLQELDSATTIIATGNQVIQPGAGGFSSASVWRELKISFYAQKTMLGVQVVGINPTNSSVTGSLYIDDIWVYTSAPQTTTPIILNNSSFSAGTVGWMYQIYGNATGAGTWSGLSSWSSHTAVLKGTQAGGEKGKASQLYSASTSNTLGSVWVYSGATSINNTQKVYLYLYSYNSSYTTIIESGNAILQPGKWTPGQWRQLQFGYTPFTQYNAVQLVGINPTGNPNQAIYFDAVEVKQ